MSERSRSPNDRTQLLACRATSRRGSANGWLQTLRYAGWLGYATAALGCHDGSDRSRESSQQPTDSAGASSGPNDSDGLDSTGIDSDSDSDTDTLAETTYAPGGLRRLTRAQYEHSIQDLFNTPSFTADDLEPDLRLGGYSNVGAAQSTVSAFGADRYEASARELLDEVFSDSARRAELVECSPTAPDDPCIAAFVARFGRKLWRRPLTTAEVERYTQVAADVSGEFDGDAWAGLQFATLGLLQSPHFLYRVELGESDPDADTDNPDRLRYTAYELASRLSYTLLDTTPDDALLDAAELGELLTTDGLQAQVQRLANSPRVQQSVGRFFTEFLGIDALEDIDKDPQAYPEFDPVLAEAMRREVELIVNELVFAQDADIRTLLDTQTAYVDEGLAALYGLAPPPAGPSQRTTLDPQGPRAGFLTTGAFLTIQSHALRTSPTRRGKFIADRLLCFEIPSPPPDAESDLPENDGSGTARERLERHSTEPACASCHQFMDPFGFALEKFDAIGAYRETENNLPIDTTGELDGVAYDGAKELAAVIKNHPRVGPCLTRQLYRHALAHLDTPEEEILLDRLSTDLTDSGFRFLPFFQLLVTSDAFRYLSPAP